MSGQSEEGLAVMVELILACIFVIVALYLSTKTLEHAKDLLAAAAKALEAAQAARIEANKKLALAIQITDPKNAHVVQSWARHYADQQRMRKWN